MAQFSWKYILRHAKLGTRRSRFRRLPLVAAAIIAPFRREFVYGLADASLLTMMQSHITRADGIGIQVRLSSYRLPKLRFVVAAGLCALARRRNRLLLAGFLIALVFIFETKV